MTDAQLYEFQMYTEVFLIYANGIPNNICVLFITLAYSVLNLNHKYLKKRNCFKLISYFRG